MQRSCDRYRLNGWTSDCECSSELTHTHTKAPYFFLSLCFPLQIGHSLTSITTNPTFIFFFLPVGERPTNDRLATDEEVDGFTGRHLGRHTPPKQGDEKDSSLLFGLRWCCALAQCTLRTSMRTSSQGLLRASSERAWALARRKSTHNTPTEERLSVTQSDKSLANSNAERAGTGHGTCVTERREGPRGAWGCQMGHLVASVRLLR